jgi:GH15 family glucan-1,4-alpha-glucosidase
MKLLEEVYEPLVERAADFLISYRDPDTRLPEQSYDLWERKRGTSTYTSACVYGGLKAAAELARRMNKDSEAGYYESIAKEIHRAILEHLWRNDVGLFYNMLTDGVGPFYNMAAEGKDGTIDISSVYGVFLFGILEPNEMRLLRAFETSVRRLSEGVSAGGIARFENDDYYRVPGPSTGNPWFLTTLWYAEYLTATASSTAELKRVRDIFSWAARYALPSGVLSEQLDPQNGAQVCAGPLAWAHATYIRAVVKYLEKHARLEKKKS